MSETMAGAGDGNDESHVDLTKLGRGDELRLDARRREEEIDDDTADVR